ncbi:MAG: DUF3467 domain-containing protein [Actinomycetia bacterium]|nr:DUF3467 domain-containing protein [Actinomycetes bacterium]
MPTQLYANLFAIRMGPADLALVLRQATDVRVGVQIPPDETDTVVYLSPVLAKQLANGLSQAVTAYESLYGPIPLQERLGPEEIDRLRESLSQQAAGSNLQAIVQRHTPQGGGTD